MGTLKGSYACISDRLNPIVASNEKLFVSNITFCGGNDREIGLKLKYLLNFASKWLCECLHMQEYNLFRTHER